MITYKFGILTCDRFVLRFPVWNRKIRIFSPFQVITSKHFQYKHNCSHEIKVGRTYSAHFKHRTPPPIRKIFVIFVPLEIAELIH